MLKHSGKKTHTDNETRNAWRPNNTTRAYNELKRPLDQAIRYTANTIAASSHAHTARDPKRLPTLYNVRSDFFCKMVIIGIFIPMLIANETRELRKIRARRELNAACVRTAQEQQK